MGRYEGSPLGGSSSGVPPHARRMALVVLGLLVIGIAVGAGFALTDGDGSSPVAWLMTVGIVLVGGAPLVRAWHRIGSTGAAGGRGSTGPAGPWPSGDRSPFGAGPAPRAGEAARPIPEETSHTTAVGISDTDSRKDQRVTE